MLRFLFFSGVLLTAFLVLSDIPVTHEPGVLAPNAPIQGQAKEGLMFMHDDYVIQPLATFDIKARVLSRKRYLMGRETELAPIDLALGWGQMSDEQILENFSISQSGRWYWWRADPLPIIRQEVIRSSANMHLIPADDYVKRQIKKVRRGSIVQFTGYLVEVKGDDGWRWRSSLSREDSGNNACELVYVQDFQILDD